MPIAPFDLPPIPAHVRAKRLYRCPRVPAPPHAIDADLSRPFWERVPWTDEFVDISLDAAPTLSTRAKIAWDDDALYIAARLVEPHLWATLTERDSVIFHDNDFEVFLNPTCDALAYYELEINALNTVWDLALPRPYRAGGQADNSWDCPGIRHAVRLDGTLNDPSDVDRGWSVEIAMPWRAFDRHAAARGFPPPGAPPRVGDAWLLNFSRVQWDLRVVDAEGRAFQPGDPAARGSLRYEKVPQRPEHNWVWSPMGLIDMHVPHRWGVLEFEA